MEVYLYAAKYCPKYQKFRQAYEIAQLHLSLSGINSMALPDIFLRPFTFC